MLKKIDKKICLLVAVAILFAGTLIWLAFFWQFGKIKSLSGDIQKEQLDSLIRQERSRKVFELGKELENIEVRQEEISAILINKNDVVPFLEMLENVASATDNSIKINAVDLSKMKSQTARKTAIQESDDESVYSVKKKSQAQKKTISQNNNKQNFSNQIGFSVELIGEYRSLINFLTKLENAPYLVQIYNFQITPIAKTSTTQLAESGAVQPEENQKYIRTTLTISVYTNDTK